MHYLVNKKTMLEAEQKTLEHGVTQEDLIRSVAKGVARHKEFARILSNSCKKPILLLIGRGLNGLDCLALGCELLRQGHKVAACQLSGKKSTPLSCLFFDEFSLLGGSLIQKERIEQKEWGLAIDGLLGLGAQHKKDKELSALIQIANTLPTPIVAIDLPSGIDPETGEIWDRPISAEYTFACQAPKIGSFFQKAWEHVGALYTIDIGLSEYTSDISLLEVSDGAACLPAIERTTHKYKRGVVHLIAGSQEMMGAASLAARAAFTSGSGYVCSYIPQNAHVASLLLPPEAVRTFYNPQEPISFSSLDKGAVVLGPGLGRSEETRKLIELVLEETSLPIVLDGDGLGNLPPHYLSSHYLKNAILTPHRKEAEKLFGIPCHELSQSVIDLFREQARAMNSFIILKGSPTVIFSSTGSIEFMSLGTPAMATAGSGDVLSGILGALLAQGLSRQEACRLGTILHALSGEKAACVKTAYSVRSTDLIEHIPDIFKRLLELRGATFHTYLPQRLKNSSCPPQ